MGAMEANERFGVPQNLGRLVLQLPSISLVVPTQFDRYRSPETVG